MKDGWQTKKLGEFILPNRYELEAAVNVSYADYLKLGKQVVLHNLERTKTWKGKVVRVNGKIDQASQSVTVYIELNATDLKEGMYLEADLDGRKEQNVFELNRKLLPEDKVFVVKDSMLMNKVVEPIYFDDKTVMVRGLEDGDLILAKPVPGAYNVMKVEV